MIFRRIGFVLLVLFCVLSFGEAASDPVDITKIKSVLKTSGATSTDCLNIASQNVQFAPDLFRKFKDRIWGENFVFKWQTCAITQKVFQGWRVQLENSLKKYYSSRFKIKKSLGKFWDSQILCDYCYTQDYEITEKNRGFDVWIEFYGFRKINQDSATSNPYLPGGFIRIGTFR